MTALYDYELAALALDSYQRGYFAGMADPNNTNDGLGSDPGTVVADGTVIATASILGDGLIVAADFYAVAYRIGDEIVISYRGSDHLNWPTGWNDVSIPLFGADGHDVWQMLRGEVPDQMELALEFYNRVKDISAGLPITLTGHSLGGALAGAVGALKNADAVMFDNTAYEAMTANIIRMVTSAAPDRDEALASLVFDDAPAWTEFGLGNTSAIALAGDVAGVFRLAYDVDNVEMGAWLDPVSAHIQGLLVLALFARAKQGAEGDWVAAANMVFRSLNSDAVAADVGIAAANGNPASGVMKDMIASTVLPGTNAFGNQAAISLIDDMRDLGRAATYFDQLALLDGSKFFANLAARFAGYQSKHSVTTSSGDGALGYDPMSKTLLADLRDETWLFNGHQYGFGGHATDFGGLLNDGKLDQSEMSLLSNGPSKLAFIEQILAHGGAITTLNVRPSYDTVEVRGQLHNDNIIGTHGSEQFVLGSGNDRVQPNGGINWIDGGEQIDTLVDEHAWADFQIEFDASKQLYYLALRNSGSAPRVHVVENVEFFELGGELFDATTLLNLIPTDVVVESIAGQSGMVKLQWGSYGAGTIMADLAVVDPNAHDRFTWEIVGGSNFYDIDSHGVVRAKATATFDWNFWSQRARYDTYEQWQNGQHSGLLASLLGTQYGFTVKVTDAAGASWTENFYFYLQYGVRHVYGTLGNDLIWGDQSADDIIYGLGGADDIYGFGGDDVIYGGSGNDNLYGGTGRDTIYGGDDDDYIQIGSYGTAHGDAGQDELVATGDYNALNGGDENDILRANGSGNVLQGGDGADELISAAGKWNTASYQNASSGVTLNYNGISRTGLGTGGEAAGDTLTGTFDVVGSSHSDSIAMVFAQGMTLRGGAGDDTITGQISDYAIIYGDDGNDTITVTKGPDNGYGKVYGGAGNDTISGHGELHGGSGADTITSAQGDHKIYLGVDNDVDTFVFSRMRGFDQVYDFTSVDRIEIGTGYKYDDFGDVMANSVQNGAHVDIWFESDTKITIMNFQKANLTADNFLFD